MMRDGPASSWSQGISNRRHAMCGRDADSNEYASPPDGLRIASFSSFNRKETTPHEIRVSLVLHYPAFHATPQGLGWNATPVTFADSPSEPIWIDCRPDQVGSILHDLRTKKEISPAYLRPSGDFIDASD